jgi:HrpA-like RNA helicase
MLNILDNVVNSNALIEGGYPTLLTPGNLSLRKRVKGINTDIPMIYIKELLKTKMFEYGGSNNALKDLVFLVEAKTGSGKSTTMPVELFRILKHSDENSIMITQPRVITAQDIPTNQIAGQSWAKDMILGDNLSYSTGSLKLKATSHSFLQYVTIGTLTRTLQTNTDDFVMNKFRMFIIDEVHQRDIDLDITMMYLKRFLVRNQHNKKCPIVILTSATFDVDQYAKYFELPDENIISVGGAVFPIEEHFLSRDSEDYISSIADVVQTICYLPLPQIVEGAEIIGNDILIFLPGADFMLLNKLKRINENLKSNNKDLFIVLSISAPVINSEGLDKRLLYYDYADIKMDENFKFSPTGKLSVNRRIVVSTSVAETGLTLDWLGYIIDAGFDKKGESYPPYNISGLTVKPATLANVMQRRGRVGRKFPGKFYGIYTKETFDSLSKIKLPAIILDKSEEILLKIMEENEDFELEKIDMFDPPPIESLKQALETNIALGFIEQYPKLKLSPIGKLYVLTTKLELNWFRIIISAYSYGIYIQDIVVMIAMSKLKQSSYTDKQVEFPERFHSMHIPFPVKTYNQFKLLTMDDFIEDVFLFNLFEHLINTTEPNDIINACKKEKLNFEAFMNINKECVEITNTLASVQINPFMHKENALIHTTKEDYMKKISIVKRCLYDGFITNMVTRHDTVYKSKFGIPIKFSSRIPTMSSSLMIELEKILLLEYPNYILTNSFTVADNRKNETYKYAVNAGKVSVLDGYVLIDKSILMPQL